MRKSLKLLFLIFLAIGHSYAFLYAWTHVGSEALFSTGETTNSNFLSVLVATLVSAAITTTPLAFLAGFIAGRNLLVITIFCFALSWFAFNLYATGQYALVINSTHFSLLVELLTISVFCFLFYKLGNRLGPNYAIKGTSA